MAGPLIYITLTEKPPIEAIAEAHPELMRAAYETGGQVWAEEMLPVHFTPQAARLYGHQPRKKRTLRRKLAAARVGAAILGGRVDNVFSGLLMRALLGNQRIQSQPSGVEVRLFGPRYFYQYDKRRGHPQKAAEVTTVTSAEQRRVAQAVDRDYGDGIKALANSKTTTFGGAS